MNYKSTFFFLHMTQKDVALWYNLKVYQKNSHKNSGVGIYEQL
jgi:hypothetical protein